MKPPARRRCRHCRQHFLPDYRNTYHQRFCFAPACQLASKQASQRRWLRKPQNRNYFRESDNLERVRRWREAHPGYWRAVRHRCQQPPDKHSRTVNQPKEISIQARTLQDLWQAKFPVFTGLMSLLSGCALQQDIAGWVAQVVNEAQCILVRCQLNNPPPGQLELPINYHESG
jgi:hypothetical protein